MQRLRNTLLSMNPRMSGYAVMVGCALALTFLFSTCRPVTPQWITRMIIENGKFLRMDSIRVSGAPVHGSEEDLIRKIKAQSVAAWSASPFVDPMLREKVRAYQEALADTTPVWDTLLVAFLDTMLLPRFPELAIGAVRDSVALDSAASIVRGIKQKRAAEYRRLTRILEHYDAQVLDSFWLINAVVVRMPLSSFDSLEKRRDVVCIEYVLPDEHFFTREDIIVEAVGPPVAVGRALIGSDPYAYDESDALDLTGGWVGLLDTGMRFDHVLFDSTRLGFRRDCVNGGEDCKGPICCANGGEGCSAGTICPEEACGRGHGTSSGALITAYDGRDSLRGVTNVILDSFRVNACTARGNDKLDHVAAVRGFENAVAALDKVIVAEMQDDAKVHNPDDSDAYDRSCLSLAADNAFDTGAVIIAPNGNHGRVRTDKPKYRSVDAPAVAHKVIGVGAFCVELDSLQCEPDTTTPPGTLITHNRQGLGPAPDGRIKPDLQAPTNTLTAIAESDTALGRHFATSGAAPYVAGAAALLRNLLKGNNPAAEVDPGQVYAQLILAGQRPFNVDPTEGFSNIHGAGRLLLPPLDGLFWSAKIPIRDGETRDLPLKGIERIVPEVLDAALWWPESAIQRHNNIDLFLVAPDGTVRDFSTADSSVFERARVDSLGMPGIWKVRIVGTKVPTKSQIVYWAAHARRKTGVTADASRRSTNRP